MFAFLLSPVKKNRLMEYLKDSVTLGNQRIIEPLHEKTCFLHAKTKVQKRAADERLCFRYIQSRSKTISTKLISHRLQCMFMFTRSSVSCAIKIE